METSKYVIGVDVSKYEVSIVKNNMGVVTQIRDWWSPDKATKPIDFVIQRTSYGGKQDEYLDLMYSECVKVSIRGAYHYFNSGVTWEIQLATILQAIKGKKYHFLAVDYEKAFNNLNGTTFAEMMELINQLKKITGLRVLCYFSPDIYKTAMRPYNADAVINKMDSWIAQYPYALFVNLDKPPVVPGIAKPFDFWQYGGADVANTAGYNAGLDYGSWRHGMDLIKWRGTLDELKAWAKVDDTPVPPVVIPPTLEQRVTNIETRLDKANL